jgi:hypothetical protein
MKVQTITNRTTIPHVVKDRQDWPLKSQSNAG